METGLFITFARDVLFEELGVNTKAGCLFLYRMNAEHVFDAFIRCLSETPILQERIVQRYATFIENLMRCYDPEDVMEITLETALSDILFHEEKPHHS